MDASLGLFWSSVDALAAVVGLDGGGRSGIRSEADAIGGGDLPGIMGVGERIGRGILMDPPTGKGGGRGKVEIGRAGGALEGPGKRTEFVASDLGLKGVSGDPKAPWHLMHTLAFVIRASCRSKLCCRALRSASHFLKCASRAVAHFPSSSRESVRGGMELITPSS